MVYLMIFICILNVVLWAVFLIKFKKLFTTDSIIEKTRIQLNQLIKDIDKSADRDIYLAEETSKRLAAAVKDAEQKMNLFYEASERLRDMIAEADKINRMSNQEQSLFQDFNKISNKKTVPKHQLNSYIKNSKNQQENIDPDATYEIKKAEQGDLFDSIEDNVKIDISSQETKITEDGAAFREVPLIITKVLDEKPGNSTTGIQIKSDNLNKTVKRLSDEGFSVEEIASKLSCSITEVQFIIDMSN